MGLLPFHEGKGKANAVSFRFVHGFNRFRFSSCPSSPLPGSFISKRFRFSRHVSIPELLLLFQTALHCSGLVGMHVRGLLWCALGCSKSVWAVLSCSVRLWAAQVCSGLAWVALLGCFGLRLAALCGSGLLKVCSVLALAALLGCFGLLYLRCSGLF